MIAVGSIPLPRPRPGPSDDTNHGLAAGLRTTRLARRATRLQGSAFRCGGVSLEHGVGMVANGRHRIVGDSLSKVRIARHPRQQLIDVFALMAPCNFWIHTWPSHS